MAARLWALEDDMSCPMCCDLYNDPVVLHCSHSFCRVCLDTFWEDKLVRQCPVCRSSSSNQLPTTNLVLRNIIEASTRERAGDEERGEAAAGRRRSGESAGGSGGEESQGRRGAGGSTGGEESKGRRGAGGSAGGSGGEESQGRRGAGGSAGGSGGEESQGRRGAGGSAGRSGERRAKAGGGLEGALAGLGERRGRRGAGGSAGRSGGEESQGRRGAGGSAGGSGGEESQGRRGAGGSTGGEESQGRRGAGGSTGRSGGEESQGRRGAGESTGGEESQGRRGAGGSTGGSGGEESQGRRGAGGSTGGEESQGRRGAGGSTGRSGGEEVEESHGRRRSEGSAGRSGGEELEGRCRQHGERLLLYCLEDQQLLCVVCQTARRHREHQMCPVDEAAEELKEEMRAALIPLKEKLEMFQKARNENEKTADHIKNQAIQTKKQITCEFEELHTFLHGEEKTRLSVLAEETEVKTLIMAEKLEHLAIKEASLSDTIRELERGMETSDLDFLQAFNINKERTKCTLTDPEPVSNALIEVAKHLSNLKFTICRTIMDTVQYTPVTLDPNTADDLTSVCFHGDQPHIPDNPECFDEYVCVLGAEVFTSGHHSWDVDVGTKTHWDLGVVRQNVSWKTDTKVTPEHGFWALALRDDGVYSACTMPWTRLKPRRKPRKVRVCLDYKGGEVSFYNVEDMSLLHSFSSTFIGGLLSYFSGGRNHRGPSVRENNK